MVVVSRVFESQAETSSLLHAVATFDLDNPFVLAQAKADYDLIREAIINKGFHSLTGRMGVIVQPRTKGAGHGSTSRAFYARKNFVAHILNINRLPFIPPVESD